MRSGALFKLLSVLAILSPVSAAYAQAAAPDSVTLTVTPAELDTIGDALQFMPKYKADPLLNKLVQQYQQQIKATKPPAPPPAKPEAKKE